LDRRKFLLSSSLAVPGLLLFKHTGRFYMNKKAKGLKQQNFNEDLIKKLADASISLAKQNGASYSDFRLSNFRSQRIFTRENVIQDISDNENYGFSVRVLIDGAWGFASSSTLSETEVLKITNLASEISKANKIIQKRRVELVPVPAYVDEWKAPVKKNPFDVSADEKVNFLFQITKRQNLSEPIIVRLLYGLLTSGNILPLQSVLILNRK
jgi:TldD protein